MSTSDSINYRLSPNEDTRRPLSTYDNLNANHTLTGENITDDNMNNGQTIPGNANEFPFGDISFRFDELRLQQQHQNGQTTTTICQRHEYENVIEKPVHSPAKSRFLGLNGDVVDSNGVILGTESMENDPLLDEQNHIQTTRTQYQNVPNNSVAFMTNTQENPNESLNESITITGIERSSGTSSPMKSTKSVKLDNSNFRLSQSLSQAVYMSTTVPQNIKGSNIMGSHTPTRTSLRHSRMLVVNKNYQGVRRKNPLNIRHPLFAKIVYILHILVGLTISCLGLWLCWWAPSTRAKENPYWSGLILMLSGILGLIVIGFRHVPRHKLRQQLFTFLRVNSSFVTSVAAVCTFVAFTFATLHLISIMAPTTVCRPSKLLISSSECTCLYGEAARNTTIPTSGIVSDGFYYRDLSCSEVMGPFKYILIASAIFNFIGFLLCCLLLLLLCARQHQPKRVPYSTSTSRHRL